MKEAFSDPARVEQLLQDREEFLARVADRLGSQPSDFLSAATSLRSPLSSQGHRTGAGVLVPLCYLSPLDSNRSKGTFVFQLIKRSAMVPQPGDLSCPGGMLSPLMDHLLRMLLVHGPIPTIRGEARRRLRQMDPVASRIITLYLATALRESWEEVRLKPWHTRFLGPLPTYSLALFNRTIFPLCALIAPRSPLCPNREVERMVQIPVSSFFRKEQIGFYRIEGHSRHGTLQRYGADHPCLFHQEADGREEVLWGATFQILTSFLEGVLDYHLADWQGGRVFTRSLHAEYLTGKPAP